MAASNTNGQVFDADTAERVLDEHRATCAAVEELFRVHIGKQAAGDVGLETITDALRNLNHTVVLAVDRGNGTEYLLARETEDGREWYSVTDYPHRTLGPLPIYEHNARDRIHDYTITVAKKSKSPYAGVELPAHDLDESSVEVEDV